MTMGHITWETKHHQYGPDSHAGCREGLELFTITWDVWHRGDEKERYKMVTHLPGYRGGWRGDDIDQLKERAEDVFKKWLSGLNLTAREG